MCFLAAVGCEKTELKLYEGGSSIYFSVSRDTMSYSWGIVDGSIKEQTLNLPIHLLGHVTDYDRVIKISTELCTVDSVKAVEGVDFKPVPKEVILPAGENGTYLPVVLLRTEALKTQLRMFSVIIEESEAFDSEYNWRVNERTQERYFIGHKMTIVANENFPKPGWWGDNNADFGYWSYKKADLICTLLNIPRAVFIGNSVGVVNSTRRKFYGKWMQHWLNEQNPPILEEDGTPMVMGPAAQE